MVERIGPLGWGETMDVAFALCRANFWPLIGQTAVGVSILTPLGLLLPWALRSLGSAAIPEVVAGYLIQIVGYNLLTLWLLQSIRAILAGEPIGWRKSFRLALGILIPSLITGLLWMLVLVLGLVLLVIPGILIVPVYGALYVPVMVFEGRFYLKALRRSYHLVMGSYWKIGTIWFCYSVTEWTAAIAFVVPLLILFGTVSAVNPTSHLFVDSAVGLLSYVGDLILPFSVCLVAVIYRERVASREGEDLEISLLRLEAQN